ncbi:MAG: tRNA uridine-5-carboxymethylaminomethyl(34) synthesis GTPase MnmE [Blastocatellia bacterium]|nr:tRNA uridine-5-carboxymethylaminomethyl(34) synthesis GTPase MnmE [Blastocatellia bacterium]
MSNTSFQDTIVAISSPPGRGAVGMVRLSGPAVLPISERLFQAARPLQATPFRMVHGNLVDPETNHVFDDVLGVFFPTPRSFTGEDVVEFHCHGAPIVLQQAVQCALRLGARPATPGEFTMRAFLNQRINLTQAEGIRDLINAQTTYQAQLAVRQTQGALSKRLQPAKEALLSLIVHLESAVEFVDENLDTHSRSRLIGDLARLESDLQQLVDTWRAGHFVREGVNLAIIGRPNVGKSSLFNALLDSERAIVTHLPGTTRDTLTETVTISGLPVHLVDTAGIRATTDLVEQIGVERTYTALADADIVLVVLNAAEAIHPDETALFELIRERNVLVAVNKCDLPHRVALFQELADKHNLRIPPVFVSARTRVGLNQLRQEIWDCCSGHGVDCQSDLLITDARHAESLNETVEALQIARQALEEGYSEEVPLASLHQALGCLGIITGEVTIEGIFDRIFSTFCIGK